MIKSDYTYAISNRDTLDKQGWTSIPGNDSRGSFYRRHNIIYLRLHSNTILVLEYNDYPEMNYKSRKLINIIQE